ncbi:hypothetical protein Tco_0145733 [Tanacetum coccineum]
MVCLPEQVVAVDACEGVYSNCGIDGFVESKQTVAKCVDEIDKLAELIGKHEADQHWAVRTHMRILSVVRIEVFPMYGYNYMKKIVLRRADLKEYVIAERDFKYLYPSDFEDLYLDKYGVQMIMRFNEIHKFSDGTLHQIDEALDYRVKEFRVNRRNPGMITCFYGRRKTVDIRAEYMFAHRKLLKTRVSFRIWKALLVAG